MDPTLAEIYGTLGEEFEKDASAEDESGDEGMDDDEYMEYLAQQVLEGGEEQSEEAPAEEYQEKLAEADYLGRVMAHAYVQELNGIQKVAEEQAAAEAPMSRTERAKEFGKKHWKKGAIAGGTIAAAVGGKKLHSWHKQKNPPKSLAGALGKK